MLSLNLDVKIAMKDKTCSKRLSSDILYAFQNPESFKYLLKKYTNPFSYLCLCLWHIYNDSELQNTKRQKGVPLYINSYNINDRYIRWP